MRTEAIRQCIHETESLDFSCGVNPSIRADRARDELVVLIDGCAWEDGAKGRIAKLENVLAECDAVIRTVVASQGWNSGSDEDDDRWALMYQAAREAISSEQFKKVLVDIELIEEVKSVASATWGDDQPSVFAELGKLLDVNGYS